MSKRIALGALVSEFSGGYPDIPVPADINVAELDAEPFWVTLPVVPSVGAVSANGLLYDDALAEAIVEQINSKRPGANFGHLAEDERDVAFPHPAAFWVAARRVGETVWAKCFVPAGAAREHLRQLKAVGGRIGTSIFGRGDFERVSENVRRLVNFDLETVDFAPPERAALGFASPVIVTAEMEESMADAQETTNVEQEQKMAEVTEMAQVSDELRRQIIAEYENKTGQARQVAELTSERDAAVTELEQARVQLKQMAVAEMRRTIRERVREYADWPAHTVAAKADLSAFRATVVELVEGTLGDNPDPAKAVGAVDVAWARLKPVAELLRDRLAGPPAIVNGKVAPKNELVDTPEARQAAINSMGIQV